MRHLRLIAILATALALVLGLSWCDVLPGGWRLRGWIQPHAVRSAREQARHRSERLLAFAAENQGVAAGAVLFIGSSTIELWPLEKTFQGKPCVNRGIAGESLLELLERLAPSLPEARPAAIVLYLASIDVRERTHRVELVAEAARLVIEELRARFPGVPQYVIEVLPERDQDERLIQRLAAINAALMQLCTEMSVTFVRTGGPPLALANGDLGNEFARDRVHLNDAGYRVLAEKLLAAGGPIAQALARE